MKILVVDDHLDTAVLVARVLGGDGHDVHRANSFAEGLAIAAQTQVDLLLTDIEFPDGNGMELLARVRALHATAHGIALTGHAMQREVDTYAAAGFWKVLVKPISLGDLRAAVFEFGRSMVLPPDEQAALPAS